MLLDLPVQEHDTLVLCGPEAIDQEQPYPFWFSSLSFLPPLQP